MTGSLWGEAYTFTSVTAAIFNNDGLDAYHVLTSQGQMDSPGFIVPPRGLFNNIRVVPTKEFILDWTSLPLLHRLSKELELKLPRKLGISQHLVAFLTEKLEQKRRSKPVELSIEVIGDSVRPHSHPPEFHQLQIAYLTELLEWIKTHCTMRVVTEKLDLLRQANFEKHNEEHIQYLLDTAFLASPDNTLLVTDDAAFLKVTTRPNNTISTEAFLAAMFPAELESQIIPKLLELQYVGLTLSATILERELANAGWEFTGRAGQCLKSLPRQAISQLGTLEMVLAFVAKVYSNSALSAHQKRHVSKVLLENCLKRFELTQQLRVDILQIIAGQFRGKSSHLSSVTDDFKQAWQVVSIAR